MNMNSRKHRSRRPLDDSERAMSRPSSRAALDSRGQRKSAGGAGSGAVEDNPLVSTNISTLNPDTIRWIRRRKKATGKDSVSGQVLPSKAKQLKEIFDSLDAENTGTISIKAMRTALRFVNHSSTSFLLPTEGSQSSASRTNSYSQSFSASQSFSYQSQTQSLRHSTNASPTSPPSPRHKNNPGRPDIKASRIAAIAAVAGSHVPFQTGAAGVPNATSGSPRSPGSRGRSPTRENSASPGRQTRDNKALLSFFTAMDSNRDGVINFNDFLAAMTTEATDSKEVAEHDNLNPQEEFVDFATKHKRHKIIEYTKDSTKTDLEKYEELKKLFTLTYFTTGTIDLSVHDKLARVKSELQSHLKELRSESFLLKKRRELVRAREAMLFFDAQRKRLEELEEAERAARREKSLSTAVTAASSGHSSSSSARPNTPGAVLTSVNDIVYSGNEEVDRQIRKRFAQFALHKEQTYTPKVEEVERTSKSTHFRQLAREEIDRLKNDKFLAKNVPPILPPISLKDRLSNPGNAAPKPRAGGGTRMSAVSLQLLQG